MDCGGRERRSASEVLGLFTHISDISYWGPFTHKEGDNNNNSMDHASGPVRTARTRATRVGRVLLAAWLRRQGQKVEAEGRGRGQGQRAAPNLFSRYRCAEVLVIRDEFYSRRTAYV